MVLLIAASGCTTTLRPGRVAPLADHTGDRATVRLRDGHSLSADLIAVHAGRITVEPDDAGPSEISFERVSSISFRNRRVGGFVGFVAGVAVGLLVYAGTTALEESCPPREEDPEGECGLRRLALAGTLALAGGTVGLVVGSAVGLTETYELRGF